jgi:type II secretory pathway pseudopilin PulG
MMRKSRRFLRLRALRGGATLIEVMAGLVVLGVLVASVVIARGRAGRQWAEAERRIVAAKALDAMVSRWMDGGGEGIPVSGGGRLEGGFEWRASVSADAATRELGAAVVRVEVLERGRRVLWLELLRRVEGSREGDLR